MKKLCYDDETKKISACSIFLCIMGFIIIISVIVGLLSNRELPPFPVILAFVIFTLLVCTVLIIEDKDERKYRKEYRKKCTDIQKNGIRVEGTIIKFNRYTSQDFKKVYTDIDNLVGHSASVYTSYYTVTVEYVNPYTNEKLQYETPKLSCEPSHWLGSKKCNVYILDKQIYVTDFVKKNKGENNSWNKKDSSYDKNVNAEKKEEHKTFFYIILGTLIWIGIVLFGLFKW